MVSRMPALVSLKGKLVLLGTPSKCKVVTLVTRGGYFSRGVFWISPNTTSPFPLHFLNNWHVDPGAAVTRGGVFFSGQVVARVTTLHLDGAP